MAREGAGTAVDVSSVSARYAVGQRMKRRIIRSAGSEVIVILAVMAVRGVIGSHIDGI